WAAKYPDVKLVNMFGITETTVHVTYKEIGAREIDLNISNIGKPVPTLCTYIMDRNLKLLPTGTAGELCVGGAGVGRGYLNQPELTAEKFIPAHHSGLLYKTGDLTRFLEDGEMEYLGRIDQQVQIRGFRVELGEIESRLLKHEMIKESVVIARSDKTGDKYLCAYIAVKNADPPEIPSPSGLRQYLSQTLPDYMLPAYFVVLERIPLTPNGKVDRRQLPEPEGISLTGLDYAAPRSDMEKRMVSVWQQVLELDQVGIKDNFFNIGGDSIKAIRLISALNEELNMDIKIKDLYAGQTIEELAGKAKKSSRGYGESESAAVELKIAGLKGSVLSAADPTGKSNIEDIFPMSDIEKGIVFYYLKNTEVIIYHDQFVYPMKFREFDVKLFKQAMNLLVEKHQILRTGFNVEDFAEPAQIVYKKVPFHMSHFDISHLDRPEQEAHIINYLAQDKNHPFEAAQAPLFRMAVFILDEENIFTALIFHHAVLDGWSAASLITELHNTYLDLKSTPGLTLSKLKSSYRDMVVEEIIEKEKPENRNFWTGELAGYKRLEFPRVLNRENKFTGMITYDYDLSRELLAGLKKTAENHYTSVKDLCFAAYIYVLAMLCNESDIVVGSVGNNRPQKQDGDKVLGCFLNTLPYRIKIPVSGTWSDYIAMIAGRVVEIKKYEWVSLFEIAIIIGEKSREQNPIFDTLFNFIDFHIYFDADSEYVHQQETVKPPFVVKGNQDTNTLFDFEISITFGEFILNPKYNYLAISHEMVRRACVYFERILGKFVEEPHTIARKHDIVPEEERRRLLYEFNDTAAPYDRNKLLHRLFEEQVEKRPGAIAVAGLTPYVVGGSLYGCLSYRELNKRANQLARALRQRGLQAVDLAAVVIDRSLEMIQAVMGILKAGGAYVPLEPYLPDTRIRKLLESLNVKYGVTNHLQLAKIGRIAGECPELEHILCLTPGDESPLELPELPRGKRVILPGQIEENPAANPAPTATASGIAYIIFTSGSTGTPKGVVVRHRPVINLIEWVNTTFEIGPADKIIFVSSLGFDLSVYDIFGILGAG
ncbi:MAG: AMP-binding protein, partial [Candidatus Aminicenantes bacterium]|nr:AMP-binding protein [Candidatus Aminicenantes bacterium]